jgi:hypothetical protein
VENLVFDYITLTLQQRVITCYNVLYSPALSTTQEIYNPLQALAGEVLRSPAHIGLSTIC